jgi:hypothetical protein
MVARNPGKVIASLLFGVLTWCCLYICWNAGEPGRLRNRVARAWVVLALLWGAVELLPEVVVLAALSIGVWIELALTARKRRSSAAGGENRSSS